MKSYPVAASAAKSEVVSEVECGDSEPRDLRRRTLLRKVEVPARGHDVDKVKVYVDRTCKQPFKIVSRSEARKMKEAGRAYFCNHGRDLCLNAPRRQPEEQNENTGSAIYWQTVRESRLPINLQKRLAISKLRVTTMQYLEPRRDEQVEA